MEKIHILLADLANLIKNQFLFVKLVGVKIMNHFNL